MQDLLKKIIEMDEHARKIKETAEQDKLKSEQEIEALKQSIYDDYIERAKERVEKNIAVDQQNADEKLSAYAQKIADCKADMQRRYEQHKDEWVDEILARVLA